MKIAKVFYGHTPHPAYNKTWGEIYKQIHFNKSNSNAITMKKTFFHRYYRMLPFSFEEENEQIFHNLNADNNTLGTPEGQRWIKDKNLSHTSMSVGDVIRRNGKYEIVVGSGFLKLRLI